MKKINLFSVLMMLAAIVFFSACSKKDNSTNNGGTTTGNPADTVAVNNLVGYFKFNNSVNDEKMHTAMGTNVTYTTDRFGNVNSAYKGDTNAFIEVTPATDFKTSSITMSMWLRAQPFTGGTSFILTLIDPNIDWNAGYGIWQEGRTGDTLRYKAFTRHLDGSAFIWTDTQYGQTSDVLFPPSKWYQLVYTYDASTSIRDLYMNGEKVLADTLMFNGAPMGPITVPSTAQGLFIGKDPNTAQSWIGNYVGDLDDLRIYNTALNADQVKALFDGENMAEGK